MNKVDVTIVRALNLPAEWLLTPKALNFGDLGMGTLPGWDSYGHLSLMLEFEKAFDVELGVDDWRELRTVAALRRRFGGTS